MRPLLLLALVGGCEPSPEACEAPSPDPPSFGVQGMFDYDAAEETASVVPVATLVSFFSASTLDASGAECGVTLTYEGERPAVNAEARAHGAWIGFDVPGDLAHLDSSCGGLSSDAWGGRREDHVVAHRWGCAIGPLDPDVEVGVAQWFLEQGTGWYQTYGDRAVGALLWWDAGDGWTTARGWALGFDPEGEDLLAEEIAADPPSGTYACMFWDLTETATLGER